jgi:hypothetical protein
MTKRRGSVSGGDADIDLGIHGQVDQEHLAGADAVGIVPAAGKLGRWVEIVNRSFEAMFYRRVPRRRDRGRPSRWPCGVLAPEAFSPQLTSDLAQALPASKGAQGHFLVLALTDPGNDLIVTNLADPGKSRN